MKVLKGSVSRFFGIDLKLMVQIWLSYVSSLTVTCLTLQGGHYKDLNDKKGSTFQT